MLTGSLKSFSFTNLMQMCFNDNTTGTIQFTKDTSSYAKMGFTGGRLTHAQFLENTGIRAVKQLTLLEDLDFQFSDEVPETKPNVETDINFLLLECSRYLDECTEHLEHLKDIFQGQPGFSDARIYQYGQGHFIFYDVYTIRYFEIFDQEKMKVVYHDGIMDTRIELQFSNRVLTNDLLMFMSDKGIFK